MNIGSLFAGIGGLELGLEAAGVGTVTHQVEIDPYCRRVLAKHWPDAVRYEDVRDVRAKHLAGVELLCGGFPCVEVSSAGKKRGLVGASALWLEFARLVRELRPRVVVVENTADLLTRGLGAILGTLAQLGYDAEWSVLSACAVGAPHTRSRVFVIAYPHREGEPARTLDAQAPRMPPTPSPVRHGWDAEPPDVRVADGIFGGLQRTRALGRAVVPQCAYEVGLRVRALPTSHR